MMAAVPKPPGWTAVRLLWVPVRLPAITGGRVRLKHHPEMRLELLQSRTKKRVWEAAEIVRTMTAN